MNQLLKLLAVFIGPNWTHFDLLRFCWCLCTTLYRLNQARVPPACPEASRNSFLTTLPPATLE
jgi:hypothetical protein